MWLKKFRMPFRIQFRLVCDSNDELYIQFLFPQTYRVFYWVGQDIDEDELNRELEELEQEELDKELIGVGPSSAELPEVPTGEIREPAAASEKKKGTHRTPPFTNAEQLLTNDVSPIAVVPKPAEEDEDMKLLMSWAN